MDTGALPRHAGASFPVTCSSSWARGKKKKARFVRSIRYRKEKKRAKSKWWVCAHVRLLHDRGMMVWLETTLRWVPVGQDLHDWLLIWILGYPGGRGHWSLAAVGSERVFNDFKREDNRTDTYSVRWRAAWNKLRTDDGNPGPLWTWAQTCCWLVGLN